MRPNPFRLSRLPRSSFSMRACAAGMFTLCLAAPVISAEPTAPQEAASGKRWVIDIRPLADDTKAAVSDVTPAPAPQPSAPDASVSAASGPLVPRMTYAQALASIPFSRAEYEANPSYRHDSAMELMFGQMRPTTLVRQTMPYFSRYPDFIRNRFQIFPYPYQAPSLNMNYFWSTNAYTN